MRNACKGDLVCSSRKFIQLICKQNISANDLDLTLYYIVYAVFNIILQYFIVITIDFIMRTLANSAVRLYWQLSRLF